MLLLLLLFVLVMGFGDAETVKDYQPSSSHDFMRLLRYVSTSESCTAARPLVSSSSPSWVDGSLRGQLRNRAPEEKAAETEAEEEDVGDKAEDKEAPREPRLHEEAQRLAGRLSLGGGAEGGA